MRQGWNILPPLSPYLYISGLQLHGWKGHNCMNDKRDYIIMTLATLAILALLILFYSVLSCRL